MITTANLGLTVWDSENDDFEHSQLADNFVRIDAHSHLGGLSEALNAHDELPGNGHWTNLGLGTAIKTGAIEPEAIWRYLLKLRSVGHKQIDIEGVESENVAEKNILNQHISDEAVDDRTLKEETITIDKLDPNILTLGSVILWFKYSVGAQPGDLWHLCDGTAWSSIPNALGLSSGFIPDLRERFVRGTDLNHTGEVGGTTSVDLKHHHNVSAVSLNHTHTVASHNHVIGVDGEHRHGFLGEDGSYHQLVQQLARGPIAEAEVRDVLFNPGTVLPRTHETTIQEPSPMEKSGLHSHGGYTGLSAAFATGESSLAGSIETDVQLANISVTPPFVGLCYVMRVR